jgi:hypothetical protein
MNFQENKLINDVSVSYKFSSFGNKIINNTSFELNRLKIKWFYSVETQK